MDDTKTSAHDQQMAHPDSSNREISEEEALVCLAEGWSMSAAPTAEMLAKSYYAKTFKKIRSDKFAWNWCSAFCFDNWLFLHKMYVFAFIYTVCRYILVICPMANQIATLMDSSSALSWGLALFDGIVLENICEFLIDGILGNSLMYFSVKRRYKKCYHKVTNYRGRSCFLGIASFLCSFSLFVFAGIIGIRELIDISQGVVHQGVVRDSAYFWKLCLMAVPVFAFAFMASMKCVLEAVAARKQRKLMRSIGLPTDSPGNKS
ncbi:MAG: hypothetical protein LBF66_01375 [Holosporales bacterium]|jgi:hypothetical protein|nr:hypothetical protein [Holosporales bacterium]